MLHLCAWILISLVIAAHAAAQPVSLQDAHKLRQIAMAIHTHAQENEGRLPPDLASMSRYLENTQNFVSPIDHVEIPKGADAAWINEHSSYRYLGGALNISEIPSWEHIVIAHLNLESGIPTEPSENNPEGRLFSVAFFDSHVELLNRADAQRVIAESTIILEGLRKGGPLPDGKQAVWDLTAIMRGVRAYAKAHAGKLPPDLGATLEFIPTDPKRAKTAAQKATAFLSPRAKRETHIPEEPTAEWVNQHASYIYLGTDQVSLASVESLDPILLIHARMDGGMDVRTRTGEERKYAVATGYGSASLQPEKYFRWLVDVSRRAIDSIRTGAPLPDHLDAKLDVRFITRAIVAYAKAHDDHLPPDLGATLEYLPPDAPAAPKDRARIYLSPKAERAGGPPDEGPTPEWINRRASYTYLGNADTKLSAVQKLGWMPLIHGRADDAYDIMNPQEIRAIPIGDAYASTVLFPVESLDRAIEESRNKLQAAREAEARH